MKEVQDLNIKINDRSQPPIEILIGGDIAGKLYCREQHILTPKLTDLWTLDVLGIENPEERKSNQEHEQDILDNFQKTVTRKSS
ncbi:hypothetical protein Zmor_018235 [Zophobas morio]|uniref:Uncharacterized protein n=1 Tax=Zophobas morio TaxID=2755281 RepID=A0AA38MDQ9_9CUCU|nr:hypothetical protein Zmor_018235 [Zophobas morio]